MAQHAARLVTGDALARVPTTGRGDSNEGRRGWLPPDIGTFDFDSYGDFDTSVPPWQDSWPLASVDPLASLMSSFQDYTTFTAEAPSWSPAWTPSTPTWQAALSSALPSATWLSQWPPLNSPASSAPSAMALSSTTTALASTQDVVASTSSVTSSAALTATPISRSTTSLDASSATATASPHAAHASTSHSSSLSHGAVVAIAAGSALVLLLLIAFLVMTICWSRRRRREGSNAKGHADGVYIDQYWRSDEASMSDASQRGAAVNDWRDSVTPYTLGAGTGPHDGARTSEATVFGHDSYTSRQQQGMAYASTMPRQVVAGPLSQQQQQQAMMSTPPVRSLTAFADPSAAYAGHGDRASPARASSSLTMTVPSGAWTARPMHTRGGQGHNVSVSTMASSSGAGSSSSSSSSLLDVTKGDVQVKTASPVEPASRAHVLPAAAFKRCSARPTMTTTAMQQPAVPANSAAMAPVKPLNLAAAAAAVQQGQHQQLTQVPTPTSARHDPRARLRYLSSISASSPTTTTMSSSTRSSDQSFTCADAQTLPPYRLTATPPRPYAGLRGERDDGRDD